MNPFNLSLFYSFSGLLFEQFDRTNRRQKFEEKNEEALEEFDEDSEEEEDEMEDNPPVTDKVEKELYKREFDSSMKVQFLAGKDEDIDYK